MKKVLSVLSTLMLFSSSATVACGSKPIQSRTPFAIYPGEADIIKKQLDYAIDNAFDEFYAETTSHLVLNLDDDSKYAYFRKTNILSLLNGADSVDVTFAPDSPTQLKNFLWDLDRYVLQSGNLSQKLGDLSFVKGYDNFLPLNERIFDSYDLLNSTISIHHYKDISGDIYSIDGTINPLYKIVDDTHQIITTTGKPYDLHLMLTVGSGSWITTLNQWVDGTVGNFLYNGYNVNDYGAFQLDPNSLVINDYNSFKVISNTSDSGDSTNDFWVLDDLRPYTQTLGTTTVAVNRIDTNLKNDINHINGSTDDQPDDLETHFQSQLTNILPNYTFKNKADLTTWGVENVSSHPFGFKNYYDLTALDSSTSGAVRNLFLRATMPTQFATDNSIDPNLVNDKEDQINQLVNLLNKGFLYGNDENQLDSEEYRNAYLTNFLSGTGRNPDVAINYGNLTIKGIVLFDSNDPNNVDGIEMPRLSIPYDYSLRFDNASQTTRQFGYVSLLVSYFTRWKSAMGVLPSASSNSDNWALIGKDITGGYNDLVQWGDVELDLYKKFTNVDLAVGDIKSQTLPYGFYESYHLTDGADVALDSIALTDAAKQLLWVNTLTKPSDAFWLPNSKWNYQYNQDSSIWSPSGTSPRTDDSRPTLFIIGTNFSFKIAISDDELTNTKAFLSFR